MFSSGSKTAAMQRLEKELEEMKKRPPPLCSAGPLNRDMLLWEGVIVGPPGSPYANGIFRIRLDFKGDYPRKPPEVRFTTKIYHMNIADGYVCMSLLGKGWTSSVTIKQLFLGLCAMLCVPNPNDPLDRAKAKLYLENKPAYEAEAKSWTATYAKK